MFCTILYYFNFFFSFANNRFGSNKSPGGKHVTITVRETKTERTTPNQLYSGKIHVPSHIETLSLMCSTHSEQHWRYFGVEHTIKSFFTPQSVESGCKP